MDEDDFVNCSGFLFFVFVLGDFDSYSFKRKTRIAGGITIRALWNSLKMCDIATVRFHASMQYVQGSQWEKRRLMERWELLYVRSIWPLSRSPQPFFGKEKHISTHGASVSSAFYHLHVRIKHGDLRFGRDTYRRAAVRERRRLTVSYLPNEQPVRRERTGLVSKRTTDDVRQFWGAMDENLNHHHHRPS